MNIVLHVGGNSYNALKAAIEAANPEASLGVDRERITYFHFFFDEAPLRVEVTAPREVWASESHDFTARVATFFSAAAKVAGIRTNGLGYTWV